MNLSVEAIQQSLIPTQPGKTVPPLTNQPDRVHPAAVLVPLFQENQHWHLLFIKRAVHKSDRHSGQIAFPGGRSERGDSSLLDTALREAEEEIGLLPGDAAILGRLPSRDTVTDYRVTPFVGVVPWPYPWSLSPLEVDEIIPLSLDWLGNPENFEIKEWTSDPGKYPPQRVVFYQRIGEEILWGATARMVLDFLEMVGLREEGKS